MSFPLKLLLLLFGSASTVGLVLLTAFSIHSVSSDTINRQIGTTMTVLADQMQDKIERILLERFQDLVIIAGLAGTEGDSSAESTHALLDQSLKSHPEFAWLGVLSTDLRVLSQAGDNKLGSRAVRAEWLRDTISVLAKEKPTVGLLAVPVPGQTADENQPSFGLATPVRDAAGDVVGIAVAVAGWDWAHAIVSSITHEQSAYKNTDALILSGQGRVLVGPGSPTASLAGTASFERARAGDNGSLVEQATDGKRYVVGYARAKTERFRGDLGLIVLVRQEAETALASLVELRQRIFLIIVLFIGHAIAFHWVVASRIATPLLEIAAAADELRKTGAAHIPRLRQFTEVQVLSESLASLVDELKQRQDSLIALNTSLESKVQERTSALEERNASLATATDIAERATMAKSRMLAAASHDLRQPLHALNLFSLALKRRVTGSESVRLVVQIEQSLTALKTMLDKLLHVSKLDAGQIAVELQPTPIRDLIERIGSEFTLEADQRNLRFNFTSVDCLVRSDPALLETIIRNLVANAFKFTERGGILLAARSRGETVLIEVYDTGPGIEPARTERIFNEFERSSEQAHGHNDGLGLGLSIVERHAKLIDATVALRSVVGRGSRFSIALPKITGEVARPPRIDPGDRQEGSIAGLSLLLLDDNQSVLDALSQVLIDRGANVLCFSRAVAAVAALRAGARIDVAVIDYDLGGGQSGLDFIAECRRLRSGMACMILTGRTDSATLDRLSRSGIYWMTKPAAPEALAIALARLGATGSAEMLQAAG